MSGYRHVLGAILLALLLTNCATTSTLPPTAAQASPVPTAALPTATVTLPTRPLTPVLTATVADSIQTPATQPHLGQRTKTFGCTARSGLPDSACTPGAIFATATTDQICQPGYSTSVRDVSTAEKDQLYAEYAIVSHATGEYEVDHLVPLELGGSNEVANLWPELANPRPGFHEKDQVENQLLDLVCSGAISLLQAQAQIATNWLDVYSHTSTTVASAAVAPATIPSAAAVPVPSATATATVPASTAVPTFAVATVTTAPPPAPISQLAASASVSNPSPKDNQTETVTGHLVDATGKGVAGAAMSTTWHYKSKPSSCDGPPTAADGSSACSLKISRATVGYTVVIDVVFSLNGKTYTASTSFTPQ
jgi:hypothetical protein